MKIKKINRKIHYWTSVIITIPALIVFCSGLMLQVKKQCSWIQPKEHRGSGTVPALEFEAILSIVKNIPQFKISGWEDINRLDVRPGKGLIKVLLKDGWEAQIDIGTGRVLQTAFRRSDTIESLHDGSLFAGNWSKLGLGLPIGIALLILLITGLGMFRFSFLRRFGRKTEKDLLPASDGEYKTGEVCYVHDDPTPK